LGPTGYGDSPYQCFSAFAGNPYLISLDLLIKEGLLTDSDVEDKPDFLTSRINFGQLIPWKVNLLDLAFKKFLEINPVQLSREFEAFRVENSTWLDDFALFMAIKESNGGGSWVDWPIPIRKREETALVASRQTLAPSILKFAFYQFVFFRQWIALLDYAHQKGIKIIGDIPIFVAVDSSDVWSNPELFHLDDERRPTVVAGVPPDYFSPTGQLWGNPLYRWEAHKNTGFAWWLERFRTILKTVDFVRLDHFRGFSACWEIPAGNPTAEIGRWVPGPGREMFDFIADSIVKNGSHDALPIIAEDLGVITDDVVELREQYNLPGMKILQFGFSSPENLFLPHAYNQNCVAYTGTHDNDTARGWFVSSPKVERNFALRYLRVKRPDFVWGLIRSIWSSVAIFAITPMQDVLDLGTEARMNYPSRLGGNWEWRMEEGDMNSLLKEKLKDLNYLYNR